MLHYADTLPGLVKIQSPLDAEYLKQLQLITLIEY